MTTKLDKLKNLLQELFQLDQADLDFGIYRIMNTKREEVGRFLDRDLLPQVGEAFQAYEAENRSAVEAELAEAVEQARGVGVDPDTAPKVKELRAKLAQAVDVTALENEVYSHLYNFFRRYYQEGDFISLRRYKEGVYAIPYEGEEVKLHWANHDQYYIKTSEYLRDYTFKLPSGKRVHFKLAEADTEKDNNRAATGNERRFILSQEQSLAEEKGELVVRFDYRPHPDKAKQADLNTAAVDRILNQTTGFDDWRRELASLRATEKSASRTLLEKHLTDYTARNTFDYFIHKDLGGFLQRELDFYIKNEVMQLDDVESDTAPRVEQYLSKIKAIRRIAHKLIDFLAQIEDFQKRLWLKKKFVIETNWCITLDRIPDEFYPEIAANDSQRDEWVQLFDIQKIQGDLVTPAYTDPVSTEFLTKNPRLPVDTAHFARDFRDRLATRLDEVETRALGHRILLHAENHHALASLQEQFRDAIEFIYIDPPYNTGNDGFSYKDTYQHSSWASLMHDRLALAHRLLTPSGCLAVSIDQEELPTLRMLLDNTLGRRNLISTITVKRASVTGHKTINPGVVNTSEFVLIYAKNRPLWTGNQVYAERGRDERYTGFITNRDAAHEDWQFSTVLEEFARRKGIEKSKLRSFVGDDLPEQLDRFVYDNARAVTQLATVSEDAVGTDFRDAVAESRRRPHAVLLFRRTGFADTYLLGGKRILFYANKLMRLGDRVVTAEKASDIWMDVLPNDIHNEGRVNLRKGKKPETLISRLIELGTSEGDLVLDFFAGSATTMATAHKMNRRWIGVESAEYFRPITLTRMKHVLSGEPRGVSRQYAWSGGGSFKYIVVESYDEALDNLEASERTEPQQQFLDASDEAREDYMLSYMLDVETRASPSLLNIEQFRDPFNYKLKVTRNNESSTAIADLVETFNYLIGLRVDRMEARVHRTAEFERDEHGRLQVMGSVRPCGDGEGWTFRTVRGRVPSGDRVLVIWRVLTNDLEKDNLMLDTFCTGRGFGTRDMEFELIYVNGDNSLQSLRRDQQDTWEVQLIEESFHRLMFDVPDA